MQIQRISSYAKTIAVFIGLGLTVLLVSGWRRSSRLRKVERTGSRIQGDIERVSSGVDDVSEGISEALDDNSELAGEIDTAVADIESDIRAAEGIARKLKDNHRRSEGTLERLERANQRFRELLAEGDCEK